MRKYSKKRKAESEKRKTFVFWFSLVVRKRTAAIKSSAEAACRLCRDEAVKSPRSGIKAENGKLLFFVWSEKRNRRQTEGRGRLCTLPRCEGGKAHEVGLKRKTFWRCRAIY